MPARRKTAKPPQEWRSLMDTGQSLAPAALVAAEQRRRRAAALALVCASKDQPRVILALGKTAA